MRAAALALALMLVPAGAEARCKVALALGLDISSSVDAGEYALQLGGLAHAFESDEVIAAIPSPEGAHIALAVYEWSGYSQQDLAVEWTVLDSPAAVRRVAARLHAHERPYVDLSTALGKAVEFGARLIDDAPDCARRVLDISGDGVNNDGPGPRRLRADGRLEGLVVNGLAIRGEMPDPVAYYRGHVVQGPDAFVSVAESYEDIAPVMLRKLLREVRGGTIIGAVQ